MLLLDGAPYTPRGYNYFPTPIGDTSFTTAYDAATCGRDADLMAPAGVNTIRFWIGLGTRTAANPNIVACADAFAQRGIGIAWTLVPPVGAPTRAGWQDEYEQTITQAVHALAMHPATRVWLIANEIERLNGCRASDGANGLACQRAWFGVKSTSTPGMLEDLAAYINQRDPNHLVGTSLAAGGSSCFPFIGSAYAPSLDVWGLNTYPPTSSFSGYCSAGDFFTTITQEDPRPKLITEFGVDRYLCLTGETNTAGDSVLTCRSGSHDDPASQAQHVAGTWDALAAHLAGSSNPAGAVSGGIAFEFSDPWDACTAFCPGLPDVHEIAGDNHTASPADGWLNGEWWGHTYAQPPDVSEPRPVAQAFHDLSSRWASAPPPNITSGPTMATTSPCMTSAGISWDTDVPATGVVYAAVNGDALDDAGHIYADNTMYRVSKSSTALARHHGFPLLVAHGFDYRFIAASYDAAGRVVSSQPIAFTC